MKHDYVLQDLSIPAMHTYDVLDHPNHQHMYITNPYYCKM